MVVQGLSIEALVKGYEVLDRVYDEIDTQRGGPTSDCESCCSHETPQVSLLEAKYLIQNNEIHRTEILDKALEWLTQKHVGMHMYERIRGRPYNRAEDITVYNEMHVALKSTCPFMAADGSCLFRTRQPLTCAIAGMDFNPRIKKAFNLFYFYLNRVAPGLKVFAFLPTLLAKELSAGALGDLIDQGEIADGKLAFIARVPHLYGEDE